MPVTIYNGSFRQFNGSFSIGFDPSAVASSIVTNGLLAYFDANNVSSYPGTGTSLFDLSGNRYTASFGGGSFYTASNGGAFVLDGINDSGSVVTGSNPFNATFNNGMTIIGFIRRNGSQTDYTGLFFDRTTNAAGLTIDGSGTGTQLGYNWNDVAATYNFSSSALFIPNLTWSMIAFSVTSSSATLYVNTTSSVNTITHTSTTLGGFQIGVDNSNPAFRIFDGQVGNLLIYSRSLSPSEISQNYNTLKIRFGL